MPTYLHICEDVECNNEWEDFYSISQDPPKACPKCKKDTAKRVICGSSKGVVELSGHELVAKTKEDIAKLKKDMRKSEKVYSNLLGEDKYQSMQQRIDKQKRERRG